ncbi:MAG: hypothetical protein Fur0020_10800 [Thermodesulfovibrionia bacterium]
MGMKRVLILIIMAIALSTVTSSFAKEISFTQDDRDRLIRLETKVEQIEKRFEQIDRRIERLENVMMWGFGLLFTTMIGLVGFVLWDRRTALAPAIRKNKELEEREEKIERALKELAEKDPKVAEVLKHVGLL